MISTHSPQQDTGLRLTHGSRVGVIGSGPAGSFFGYFLLTMAERLGLEIEVDTYESRDFGMPAPKGCNMCGGIISESLVQNLATEGIPLPSHIVQRGIDSYLLHSDVGRVRIETRNQEKRIGSVYRGLGPRDMKEAKWGSFDAYLQDLAAGQGVTIIPSRVEAVDWTNGKPTLTAHGAEPRQYDLVAVASGVNSPTLKLFEQLDNGYQAPGTTKTCIREFFVGEERVQALLGSSMHVFLLDIPRLEFGAVIPKGDYVSVCLLGDDIDRQLIQAFLEHPEVRRCLPADAQPTCPSCQCAPKINVRAAVQPFGDRLVFIGDCGITRLYKDGIGAAYRMAKAASATAVLHGVGEQDFREHYWPLLQKINRDNRLGRITFGFTRLLQKYPFTRRGLLRMAATEQSGVEATQHMSMVLWDTFTGSAPYLDIFKRTLNPAFMGKLAWNLAVAAMPTSRRSIIHE